MKIKKELSKTEKDLKKFKKFVKMANAQNVYFVLIDDVLFVENRKEKTKNQLPDNMQKPEIKEFIIAVQEGKEKQFIQQLQEKLDEERKS